MTCQNCGNELPEGSNICLNCGFETVAPEPVKEKAPAVPGKTLGIVSLICSIASFLGICCTCALPLPIVGFITGLIGFKQAKDAGEKNTLALVGMIISIVAFVAIIIALILSFVFGFGFASSAASSSYYYY